MTYVPDSKRLTYTLDRERARYVVEQCPPGFTRLPAELIVEDTQSDGILAEQIIRGPNTYTDKGMGKRRLKFFTGLRPTAYANTYGGNDMTFGRGGVKVVSLILFRFSPDAGRLTLLYFPGFNTYQVDSLITLLVDRGTL